MAGAGKKRAQTARYEGKASSGTASTPEPAVAAPRAEGNPVGGFDGPSDDMPAQRQPTSGFGPSVGFDPARDNPGTFNDGIPNRLELPSSAYRDPNYQYIFPKLPNRPDLNTTGRQIQVRVNQFKVLQWPSKTVYQYDVHIGTGAEKRGLIRAVWNSLELQKKLRQLDKLWLFDGNKIAWCSTKSPSKTMTMVIDMDKERGRPIRIDKATGRPRENKINIRISLVGEVNMAVISGFLNKECDFDNSVLEAINFLDHCMRQMPTEHYTQIKRSFFNRGENRFGLGNVVEAMKGVYSSMRLCQIGGSFGNSTGLAVNVDVANGTFWTAQTLHQCARNLCDTTHIGNDYLKFHHSLKPKTMEGLGGGLTRSDAFKELRRLIKVKFSVRHRGKESESKVYTIKDFCFDPKYGKDGANAKKVTFSLRNKNNPEAQPEVISVYDYFRRTYNIDLEFWYLPLVKTEKDGTFPMEVCHLLPNQVYRFKTDPDQTAKMIKFAVTKPPQRIEAVKHGVNMLKWHEDPYLKHYGIKIDPNMTISNARLLQAPEVLFSGGAQKVNPGTAGRWDLRNKKFFRGNPSALVSWGVGVVNECVDKTTMQSFLNTWMASYIGHGGMIANKFPLIHIWGNNAHLPDKANELYRAVGAANNLIPQILFFILPDRGAPRYERLKKNLDCRFGVVSQMMQSLQVRSANSQYCSNVCMKVNAKLGGSTSRVAVTPSQKFSKFWKEPTMIIGADVSHPSPGSPQGSMAALTMSMDHHAARYAAAVQTNGHRVEMITTANIRSMMMPLFDEWVKSINDGKCPSHIYYFRDGVSEGQYSHVLEQEVRDMKMCIAETYPGKNIPFTVTIASKRHHLRLFPKDGDTSAGDRNGNAHPGTLVERDITHPFEYDFYLNSHSAIQGTARPTHYHVLLDEKKVPVNQFHAMIYQHCYQFMRSTTPVSLYPAVYYAHIASNRARAHEASNAGGPARGGKLFVEEQQEAALLAARFGMRPPSAKASMDRHTEVLPLSELGSAANATQKKVIKFSMWYI